MYMLLVKALVFFFNKYVRRDIEKSANSMTGDTQNKVLTFYGFAIPIGSGRRSKAECVGRR